MSFTVHIVDDEESLRDSLGFLFASRAIATRTWASGADLLAEWPLADCGCLILDVRMEGMSGPQLLDALQARPEGLVPPVIFLTGHADVPLAVQSLKAGAFDFVEKPFNDNHIVDIALAAIAAHAGRLAEVQAREAVAARQASLSAREAEVMGLMLEGLMNKQIAERLGIAMRTVEVHRSRVLAKMGARNIADLARMT
ncbi:response regulator transcription factor [Rhodobacter capsulatus]|uniref:Two component transcriptional regulator, LuxR family n=1 Tax=Rhodobacter capsulatus TaxID=1061 RepID=A0A0Q0UEX7_RHOCA|nr:response regulator [Rhodobacter capsulatus]KQB12895.1 two-component system response regulator [Rhodobacter capsulatus]KQB13057.1 two-component system response regulator [Rhodobacter capsulatus]PZX28503.1 LuxR family two component transcriptional regulator [Rhodobacter capsulatus]QNR62780.1 response regulator transcription factor [Rhodobacter capsulatus]WER08844.1 response regulator [Rhodobacter capsulatus]